MCFYSSTFTKISIKLLFIYFLYINKNNNYDSIFYNSLIKLICLIDINQKNLHQILNTLYIGFDKIYLSIMLTKKSSSSIN